LTAERYYISAFAIAEFEPPKRMFLTDSRYFAKEGKSSFEAEMTLEFIVELKENGCLLRIVQAGFPADPVADEFYKACDTGWGNTFGIIRKYFDSSPE
jgi:hypothetical protein